MQATIDAESQNAFQQALQRYCDSLRPWLSPNDSPPDTRAGFSISENCVFDETSENVTVVLSPKAEGFFRAWLRRKKSGMTSG
jgi:hypothetical protein